MTTVFFAGLGDARESDVAALVAPYADAIRIRIIKPGVALVEVEFEDVAAAVIAGLNHFAWRDGKLSVRRADVLSNRPRRFSDGHGRGFRPRAGR